MTESNYRYQITLTNQIPQNFHAQIMSFEVQKKSSIYSVFGLSKSLYSTVLQETSRTEKTIWRHIVQWYQVTERRNCYETSYKSSEL